MEHRRSSSLRAPSVDDDKDTRRRRKLSEMAGGVFYSDAPTLTRGYDNFALGLDIEKPLPDNLPNANCNKESNKDSSLQVTSTC